MNWTPRSVYASLMGSGAGDAGSSPINGPSRHPMHAISFDRRARRFRSLCSLAAACVLTATNLLAQSKPRDTTVVESHAHHHDVLQQADPHPPITLRAERAGGDIVLELGPMSLPANVGHHDIGQPPPLSVALTDEGWIRGLRIEIVDAAGKTVPQSVVHHINLIVPQKRELFSPIMLRIGAAGQETGPLVLPRLLGYRVHPGDTVLVSVMLHNPTASAYEGVRLRLHLPFVSSDAFVGAMSIVPFYLDVMPPAGIHAYELPAGHSERYWEGKPAIAGRVLAVGGHLHRYGVALRLEDRTEGKVIWEAKPITDSTGEVTSMPTSKFLWRLGIKIYPDHVYRLTAVYENPTGAPIEDGGMGALGGVFVPARNAIWPRVAVDDPEYQKDVRVTYRLDPQPAMHAHAHAGHSNQ
jgi:hypothetical protein